MSLPTEEKEKTTPRVSQMGLSNSIVEEIQTQEGHLDTGRVLEGLSDTRKSNENLKNIVIVGGVLFVLLVGAITGVSFAVAIITRQLVVDPSTGFALTADSSTIMKTAPALTLRNDMIHDLKTTELFALKSIMLKNGNISFDVQGFARKENETILLVKGGSLSYDSNGLYKITGDNLLFIMDELFVVDDIIYKYDAVFDELDDNDFGNLTDNDGNRARKLASVSSCLRYTSNCGPGYCVSDYQRNGFCFCLYREVPGGLTQRYIQDNYGNVLYHYHKHCGDVYNRWGDFNLRSFESSMDYIGAEHEFREYSDRYPRRL